MSKSEPQSRLNVPRKVVGGLEHAPIDSSPTLPVQQSYAAAQRARVDPSRLTARDVMALQRTMGNRAVAHMLSGDRRTPTVSRIQRRTPVGLAGGPVDGNLERSIQTAKNGGSSLSSGIRGSLESKLNADMGSVKIHTDSKSAQLNRDLGAKAFTHKNHIFYGAGQSPSNMKLTTHEAVHTIQQGAVQQKSVQRHAENRQQSHPPGPAANLAGSRINSAEGVVQRKKTTKPPYLELARLDYTAYGRGKATQEEKRDAIWAGIQKLYADTREKGIRNWNNLQARIEKYRQNPGELGEELGRIRSGYDKRYSEHYTSEVNEKTGKVITKGLVDKNTGSDKSAPYQNTINTESGTIIADYNYAEKDEARIHDAENAKAPGHKSIGLPNSEVLWKQYNESAKSKFWYNKEERARNAMRNINKVVRSNVQNTIAKQVIYMAYPDGMRWEDATQDWQPGAEEYEALLGTPNVAAAVFMLSDHLDELGGKTLGSITTTKDKEIEINFRALT